MPRLRQMHNARSNNTRRPKRSDPIRREIDEIRESNERRQCTVTQAYHYQPNPTITVYEFDVYIQNKFCCTRCGKIMYATTIYYCEVTNWS